MVAPSLLVLIVLLLQQNLKLIFDTISFWGDTKPFSPAPFDILREGVQQCVEPLTTPHPLNQLVNYFPDIDFGPSLREEGIQSAKDLSP